MKFSTSFQRAFHNTSWLFAEKIIRMIVGFTVGVWVARYLGPERLGVFTYAQSIVFLFSAFATLGLDGVVVRELVKHPEKRDALLGTSFILKFIGAFVTLTMLATAISLSETETSTSLIVMLIGSATVFQAFNVIDFYFQSKVLSKYVVFAQAISMLVVSSIKIILILNEAPLIWFAVVVTIEAFLIAIGLIGYYLKNGVKLQGWLVDRDIASELLKHSWPLILGSLSATIYMKIDILIIEKLLGNSSVGIYAIAIKLSEVWLFVTVAITSSLAPSITLSKSNDENRYLQKLQLLYSLLVKISVIISITIFAWAPLIVTSLFGAEYNESINILQVYIWAIIFIFLSNGSWSFYLNEGLEKLASLRLILGAVINIVLNFIFIPKFGLIGAAYATLISYAFSSFFFNLLTKRTIVNFKLQMQAIMNFFDVHSWVKPMQIKDSL